MIVPDLVALGTALLAQASGASPVRQDSVLDMVIGSGPVVRAVLLILVAFSVGCWGIALAKAIEMRRGRPPAGGLIGNFWGPEELRHHTTASGSSQANPRRP